VRQSSEHFELKLRQGQAEGAVNHLRKERRAELAAPKCGEILTQPELSVQRCMELAVERRRERALVHHREVA
jgi:hypothetical protein